MSSYECPDSIDLASDAEDFSALVGQEFDFYGVDNNCFKLDDVIYEAVEDESDGYRSYLGCVETRETGNKIFFGLRVARVVLEADIDGYFDGYKLIDLHDYHEWLRFGTDNYDDYYPTFRFEYTPKAPQEQ